MNPNQNTPSKNARRKRARKARKASQRNAGTRPEPYGGVQIEPALVTRSRKLQTQYRQGLKEMQMSPLMAHLSPCARKYCAARTDPWSELAKEACIPDNLLLPSQKVSTRARGFFATGTNNVGWIVMDPWAMLVKDPGLGITTSGFPIMATNALYSDTSYSWTVAGSALTPGVVTFGSDSPYANGIFLPAPPAVPPTFRLVGAGIRVRYTGTAFNRGGRITAYRDPFNGDLQHFPSGFTPTSATFLLTREAVTDVVSADWHHVSYGIADQDNLTYNFYHPRYDNSVSFAFATSALHRNLILYVDAPPGVPLQFEFDAISHFEVNGQGLATTPSHADPIGNAAVSTALTQEPISTKTPAQNYASVINKAMSALAYSASGVLYTAGRVAGRMALGAVAASYANAPKMIGPGGVTIEEVDD